MYFEGKGEGGGKMKEGRVSTEREGELRCP